MKTKWFLFLSCAALAGALLSTVMSVVAISGIYREQLFSTLSIIIRCMGILFFLGYGLLVSRKQPVLKVASLATGFTQIAIWAMNTSLGKSYGVTSWQYQYVYLPLVETSLLSQIIFLLVFFLKSKSWIRFTALWKLIWIFSTWSISFLDYYRHQSLFNWFNTSFAVIIISFLFDAPFYVALIVHQAKVLQLERKEREE
jgi:hypothetical protein